MDPKPKVKEESNFVPEIADYETIMRSLQAGVCQIDSEGTIVYVNDTASSMFGWNKDDLLGSCYSEVFFGSGVGREDSRCGPLEFALAEGEISHINTENLIRKDGSDFLSELICVPDTGDSGVTGAVVSFLDVTDRRQVEDAVSNARDLAVAAARTKADFLANMSHEIRTPLTGIIGTVDLLSGTILDDDQQEILTILRNSTELLHGIVNEILDYSKIEAGKFVIKREIFSLQEFIARVVEPFQSLASEKHIELGIDFSENLPDSVECDSRCVQQVLNNLLSNALKFTDDGSVTLQLRMGSAADRLKFIVRDTGIGIPEAEKEKLFAPFEQADTANTRRFEGTGLGLAISRRLVRLMGGEIGFVSDKGAGAEFWFEIPFEPVLEVQVPVKQRSLMIEDEQKPRILVVEDNPVNMEVTLRLLKQIGIEAIAVGSGEEAVALSGSREIDIVLMDCQMPGMDGYETSRIIRKNGEKAAIIAFTASVSENDLEKMTAAGMSGILRKPFTQNDLIDVVRTHGRSRKGNKTLDLRDYFREYSISKFIAPEKLKQFASLDTDPRGFLSEILGVFGDHFAEKLPVLEDGISELDRESIKSAAHNLKGSSASLGLTKISGLLETVENLAGGADIDELQQLLHEIKIELEMIRDAITEFGDEENLK